MPVPAARLRRVVAALTVLGVAVAAVAGLVAAFGSSSVVLLAAATAWTGALVAGAGTVLLCTLAVESARAVLSGVAAVVVSVPVISGVVLIWGRPPVAPGIVEVFATGVLVAGLLGVACLSAVAADHAPRPWLRAAFLGTTLAATCWVALSMPYVWTRGFDPPSAYDRLFITTGAFAVCGVLGVMWTAVAFYVGATSRRSRGAWVDLRDDTGWRPEEVPSGIWDEIQEIASASGRSEQEVVLEAVRRHREDLVRAGAIATETRPWGGGGGGAPPTTGSSPLATAGGA